MVFSQIRNHKVCYFSWETYEGNEAKAKGMRTRLLILNFKSRRSSLALDLSLFPALSFLFLTFEKFPFLSFGVNPVRVCLVGRIAFLGGDLPKRETAGGVANLARGSSRFGRDITRKSQCI